MNNTKERNELFLMQQIYTTLMSLSKKLDKEEYKHCSCLTARQYITMLAIRLSPLGEATMLNIAKKLGTTKQNINQLIPVLEKKGYIARYTYDKRKRPVNIELTDSGKKAMLDYTGISSKILLEIFDKFSEEEMEMLLHLLKKLHRYDGSHYCGFAEEAIALFESEYSGLLDKILQEACQGDDSPDTPPPLS